MSIAEQILTVFYAGDAERAFRVSIELAANISEACDHDLVRFDDNSHLRIFINDEHEIDIVEA